MASSRNHRSVEPTTQLASNHRLRKCSTTSTSAISS